MGFQLAPTAQTEKTQIVVTRGVMDTLNPDELHTAVRQLKQKMKVPDPENPNLWIVQVGPHTLWGILDEHAGANGEDVFTVIFPDEY